MSRLEKILDHLETALIVSRESLARTQGVSVRSIENDIRALNMRLAPAAQITLDNQARYRLVILDPKQYQARTADLTIIDRSFNSSSRRKAYIFESLLYATEPVTVESLAGDMNIGRSTALKDLAALKTEIQELDIQIKARPHIGYWLEGGELAIRQVLVDLYYDDIYVGERLSWQRQLLHDITQKYQLDDETAVRLGRWHTVWVDRVQSGHLLSELPNSAESVVATEAHSCAQDLIAATKPYLPVAIPATEAFFLALPLVVMRTPLSEKISPTSWLPAQDQVLADKIIARIRSEMGFTLKVKDLNMLEKFVQHIAFLLNRMRYNIRLTTHSPAIRDAYPVAFRMAELAKEVIETERGGKVADEELDFVAAYFEIFLREQRAASNKGIRVAIVAGPTTIYTKLLQMRLAELVSKDVELRVIQPEDAEALSDSDVVVALPHTRVTTNLPLLRLRADFDQQEFLNWVQRVRAHTHWGANLTGLDSTVATLADPRRFFPLAPADTYQEQLTILLDTLTKTGMLTEQVRRIIEEREAERTMQFTEYLAFPHISTAAVADLQFFVAIIHRQPQDPGVRIIFLLILPEEAQGYDDLLAQLYEEIIRLSSDKDALDRISRSETFHDYLLHFLKGLPL